MADSSGDKTIKELTQIQSVAEADTIPVWDDSAQGNNTLKMPIGMLESYLNDKLNTFQPGDTWGANLGSGYTIQFHGVAFSTNALVTIRFPKSTKGRTVTWNPGSDFQIYCNGKTTNILTSGVSWQLQRVTDWIYRFAISGTYDTGHPVTIGTNGWFSFR